MKRMKNRRFCGFHILFLGLLLPYTMLGQNYSVSSPDGETVLSIANKDQLNWSVSKNGAVVIPQVVIGMEVNGVQWGNNSKLKSSTTEDVKSEFGVVVPLKNKVVKDEYNQLTLKFKEGFAIDFRVYNEGVAYRFKGLKGNEAVVKNETMKISFNPETTSLFPLEKSTYSHYERSYIPTKVDTLSNGEFCSLPVFFKNDDQTHILFSEADVYDYPNMFLNGNKGNSLITKFPKAVAKTIPQPGNRIDRNVIITEEHPYIAKTKAKRNFPWRFFVISKNDATFIEQDMVLKLSSPSKLKNEDWIKPGRVAWDWWNANNVFNVDFKSGLNTATYKYFIDFASKQGIEYVILDEGWTKSTTEILDFNPDMDVKELIRYGEQKGVGIILWCLWKPLDENMEEILDTYAGWGAKGIKVDFMQRADQYMVNSYEQIALECAKRELLVDFHGAYKPSGLRRAYPNVISYEGVKGNEHNKWSQDLTPTHNVTLPFIRMAVGPMDYTPGAMRNAHLKNHHISFERPVSIGTRAHQVAMYMVFESGLQMYCDTPSAYMKEQETTDYITQVPSTWDMIKVLHAKIGEYIAVARKNGDDWYVGAMTDTNSRDLKIDFSFLQEGTYEALIYKDGLNAGTYAEDYVLEKVEVDNQTVITAKLAKGGGWSAIIKKK
ncbi:glycoside hydrolase family 97 protein [Zhouia amylolytica]|uniref:glycoside hydrolase family 97 protein n=1 Tax=Zhouia amylolytica TaxID=376730 RepID=UPI0020CEBA6D|nr:glycoside hydrolase family 97 protein [Zhouia amylolytica]